MFLPSTFNKEQGQKKLNKKSAFPINDSWQPQYADNIKLVRFAWY